MKTMATLEVHFKAPLLDEGIPESKWDLSKGEISITDIGLELMGQTRLSAIERFLSIGPLGYVIFQSAFEVHRQHRYELAPEDISKVVARLTGDTPTSDTINIFVQKDGGDGGRYSFYLDSQAHLWLLWGFLTRLLPSKKLELRPKELGREMKLETQNWQDESAQCQIASAFFNAIPLSKEKQQFKVSKMGRLYKDLFGAAGRQVVSTMLSAKDPDIRSTAEYCLKWIDR